MVPAADVDQLKKELEEARAKSAEYFDGWQRERADFANYNRRIERDQAQIIPERHGQYHQEIPGRPG